MVAHWELAVRGANPAAFGRRCIPPGCVTPLSNIPDILGRRALPGGRIAALGATPDLHHGLLRAEQRAERKPRATSPTRSAGTFRVEEATIADLHRAIQQGETTCRAIVQTYIERARAYNGTCTQLVTRDGATIAAQAGIVRAGSATSFPASTTAVGSVLPRFDEYSGPPIDFGRLEATSSDPTVSQQYGMVVGIANAGGINALSTLNIRGERSVSCKARCDAASGPLPASCPKACDAFRRQ